MEDSPENSPAISIRGGEPWLMGYCWPTSFKVLGVLFLEEVSSAFLPSKKACGSHEFRHWGVGQQYPGVFRAARRHDRAGTPWLGKRPPIIYSARCPCATLGYTSY